MAAFSTLANFGGLSLRDVADDDVVIPVTVGEPHQTVLANADVLDQMSERPPEEFADGRIGEGRFAMRVSGNFLVEKTLVACGQHIFAGQP
jgi:hypothetical protein